MYITTYIIHAMHTCILVFIKYIHISHTLVSLCQGELADYNLLIDKINTNTDVEEIAEDCSALQAQNNRDSKGVEILFGEKREKENQVNQVGVIFVCSAILAIYLSI